MLAVVYHGGIPEPNGVFVALTHPLLNCFTTRPWSVRGTPPQRGMWQSLDHPVSPSQVAYSPSGTRSDDNGRGRGCRQQLCQGRTEDQVVAKVERGVGGVRAIGVMG
jgi:hypothetical protein